MFFWSKQMESSILRAPDASKRNWSDLLVPRWGTKPSVEHASTLAKTKDLLLQPPNQAPDQTKYELDMPWYTHLLILKRPGWEIPGEPPADKRGSSSNHKGECKGAVQKDCAKRSMFGKDQ